MCFTIDLSATAPKTKKVFKIVKIGRDGFVRSPFKSHFEWKQRGRYKIAYDAETCYGSKACVGFYVLLNREDAEAAIRGCSRLTILELDVNPKHWLYTSDAAGAIARKSHDHARSRNCPRMLSATYRRVRVSARQHYLKWIG